MMIAGEDVKYGYGLDDRSHFPAEQLFEVCWALALFTQVCDAFPEV